MEEIKWWQKPTEQERKIHFQEKEDKKLQKREYALKRKNDILQRRIQKREYALKRNLKSEVLLNLDYANIHYWLHKTFGKAIKCENINCPHKDYHRYEWCKRRELKYDFKRENFIQLCAKCHRKYDSKNYFLIKLDGYFNENSSRNP